MTQAEVVLLKLDQLIADRDVAIAQVAFLQQNVQALVDERERIIEIVGDVPLPQAVAELQRKVKEVDKLRRRIADLSAEVLRGRALKTAAEDLIRAAQDWQQHVRAAVDPMLETYGQQLVASGLSVDHARIAVATTAELVFAASAEWTQAAVVKASAGALAEINKANAALGVELKAE